MLLPAACRRRGRWRARAASSAARCGSRGSRRARAQRSPRRCADRSAAGGSRRSRRSIRSAACAPSASVTRWSQTRSSSATMCEERTTVIPVSTTASITAFRNSRRASGSSEATGSSSTQQLAAAWRARASARPAPAGRPRAYRPSASGQAEPLDPREAASVVPARIELAAELEHVGDREVPVAADGPARRSRAAAAASFASRRGERPSTSTTPLVGSPSPITRCSSVVLPAPFGPTSAVTDPDGTSSVQSRSAHCEP